MAAAVRDSVLQPDVVETAARIVSGAGGGDAGLLALWTWVRRHFRFQEDPVDHELLRYPAYQLERIREGGRVYGDCDDAALLVGALGYAAGYPARFVVVAYGPFSGYEHVWTELLGPTGWVGFDVTGAEELAPDVYRWEELAV